MQKRKNLILLAVLMGLMLALPFTAHAWLSGWDYRSEITLIPATSVANYQVKVELTSANFTYSHAQTNGEDLRFTDTDDNLQDYWIEKWNDSGNSTIWVKVATSGTSTFYMYFDNDGASAASNGDDTFIVFDDFPGTTLNTSKWSVTEGDVTVSDGSLQLTGTTGTRGGIESLTNFSYPKTLYSRAKYLQTNCASTQFCVMQKSGDANYSAGMTYVRWTSGLPATYAMDNGSFTRIDWASIDTPLDWHTYRMIWENGRSRSYQDDVLKVDITTNVPTDDQIAFFKEGNQSGGDMDIDWVFVCEYADPEPTATVNEEEPLAVTLSTFYAFYANGTPILCWTTQSELNNLGWNVFRGNTVELSEGMQINTALIPGSGTTSLPTDYYFEDEYGVAPNNTYYYWIESVDYSGVTEFHGPIILTIPSEEETPPVIKTVLKGNFPNPFNPSTIIKFDVAENKTAELVIYTVRGQILESTAFEAGEHTYHWDASEYGSGVYLYELKSDDYVETKKMLMVK